MVYRQPDDDSCGSKHVAVKHNNNNNNNNYTLCLNFVIIYLGIKLGLNVRIELARVPLIYPREGLLLRLTACESSLWKVMVA
jgi:uncharacterized membrane protein YbjE (DUF340 family)